MATIVESEKQLLDECRQLTEKLNELKQTAKESSSQATATCPDDIRRLNLEVLDRELEHLRGRKFEIPTDNPLIVADDIISKLNVDIEESKNFAELSRKSLAELQSRFDEKTVFMKDQVLIATHFEKEIALSGQLGQEETAESVKNIGSLTDKITKSQVELKGKMIEFLDKHFPAVCDKSSRYVSLANIVQRLLKPSEESPDNPYLELQPDFWPPHIELLLRYNICCRHPDNPSAIRLLYTRE